MDPERKRTTMVLAAQAGDVPAREALAQVWLPRVYAVTLAVLARRQEAEEATQDAFAKGFRSLGSLRDPQRFGPWMLQIARNTARDRLRKRKRRPRDVELDDATHLAVAGVLPDDEGPAVAAWSALPEQPRLVVWLRVHDEMPFRDIATLLGTSKSRAFRIFREALAQMRAEVTP